MESEIGKSVTAASQTIFGLNVVDVSIAALLLSSVSLVVSWLNYRQTTQRIRVVFGTQYNPHQNMHESLSVRVTNESNRPVLVETVNVQILSNLKKWGTLFVSHEGGQVLPYAIPNGGLAHFLFPTGRGEPDPIDRLLYGFGNLNDAIEQEKLRVLNVWGSKLKRTTKIVKFKSV
jgi:hypothetical protein